jgi:hypothetical protein
MKAGPFTAGGRRPEAYPWYRRVAPPPRPVFFLYLVRRFVRLIGAPWVDTKNHGATFCSLYVRISTEKVA